MDWQNNGKYRCTFRPAVALLRMLLKSGTFLALYALCPIYIEAYTPYTVTVIVRAA